MKKLLFSLFLCAITMSINAQGMWTGEAAPFVYSFERSTNNPGNGASTLATGSSISESGKPAGLLPFPSIGIAKVTIGAGAQATLTANDATSKLALTSSSDLAAPTKFSVYKVPSATAVTSIFMSYAIPVGTANGVVNFIFGNTGSADTDGANVFSNATPVSQYYDPADHTLFGAIRLDIFGGNYPAVSFRTARTGPDGVGTPPTFQNANTPSYFEKGSVQNLEFYCNNFTNNQTYVRGGITYTVLPRTYQWWVNGAQQKFVVNSVDNFDFPSSGEIAQGLAVNSFGVVLTENNAPTANSSVATVGNYSMQYVPATVLPVKISSFIGKSSGSGVQLSFTTASEQNSSHFEVFRSVDQNNFAKIGEVKGQENSSTSQKYSFYDAQPSAGVGYYQLKQIDSNGEVNTLSSIIAVKNELSTKSEFKIISLSEDQLSFTIDSKSKEEARLSLIDLKGNLILNQNLLLSAGNNVVNLALPGMVSGIYVLVVSGKNGNRSLKFNKL